MTNNTIADDNKGSIDSNKPVLIDENSVFVNVTTGLADFSKLIFGCIFWIFIVIAIVLLLLKRKKKNKDSLGL